MDSNDPQASVSNEGEAPDGKEVSDDATTSVAPTGWTLAGGHFVVSLERMTSILAWRQTEVVPVPTFRDPNATVEAATSGTDAAFLTAGAGSTPSSVPRIAFDGIIDGGFTFGGAIGFLSSTGKLEGNSAQAEKDLPTKNIFVFAVRAGALVTTSDKVGVWLRAGFSRISSSVSSSGSGDTATTIGTNAYWNLSIDPQLVLSPAPHVAFTLGPLLDVPIAGTTKLESAGETVEHESSSSAYGVTGGLSVLF